MTLRFTKFDAEKHRSKADHNVQFAEAAAGLTELNCQDWQITALFYAAVHLVQAYFAARTSYYPQTHQDRDSAIINDAQLRTLYNDYRELKKAAVDSRYLCWPVNDFDVSEARRHLTAIQTFIDAALAPPTSASDR